MTRADREADREADSIGRQYRQTVSADSISRQYQQTDRKTVVVWYRGQRG
jgi:hypothetical protein